MTTRQSRSDLPGLQAERTSLAWERTALALLVSGVLLLLRQPRSTGPAVLVLAGFGLVLALGCAVLGARRAHRIRSGESVPVARTTIMVTGTAVVLFCLAVTGVLFGGALAEAAGQ